MNIDDLKRFAPGARVQGHVRSLGAAAWAANGGTPLKAKIKRTAL